MIRAEYEKYKQSALDISLEFQMLFTMLLPLPTAQSAQTDPADYLRPETLPSGQGQSHLPHEQAPAVTSRGSEAAVYDHGESAGENHSVDVVQPSYHSMTIWGWTKMGVPQKRCFLILSHGEFHQNG